MFQLKNRLAILAIWIVPLIFSASMVAGQNYYGYESFKSEISLERPGHSAAEAVIYVSASGIHYEINMWDQGYLNETVVMHDSQLIRAQICEEGKCSAQRIRSYFYHGFQVPTSAEVESLEDDCDHFSNESVSCQVYRYDIEGFGYGRAFISSEGQIFSIYFYKSGGSLVETIHFKTMEAVEEHEDEIFAIPSSCSFLSCNAGFCMLVDGSESVDKNSFGKSKESIHTIMESDLFSMNMNTTVSVVQFATKSMIVQSNSNNWEETMNNVDTMEQFGGLTDIIAGLEECKSELDSLDLEVKAILLYTDGNYTNHPKLKGDPRDLAYELKDGGINIHIGAIESEIFWKEEIVESMASSLNNIFSIHTDSKWSMIEKSIGNLCSSSECNMDTCPNGYCSCGKCYCPRGEDGKECRENLPPSIVPPTQPPQSGTGVLPPPTTTSNAGVIVGSVLGTLAAAAIIIGAVVAFTKWRAASAAAAEAGNGMEMNDIPQNTHENPMYESPGEGGDNPTYEVQE